MRNWAKFGPRLVDAGTLFAKLDGVGLMWGRCGSNVGHIRPKFVNVGSKLKIGRCRPEFGIFSPEVGQIRPKGACRSLGESHGGRTRKIQVITWIFTLLSVAQCPDSGSESAHHAPESGQNPENPSYNLDFHASFCWRILGGGGVAPIWTYSGAAASLRNRIQPMGPFGECLSHASKALAELGRMRPVFGCFPNIRRWLRSLHHGPARTEHGSA